MSVVAISQLNRNPKTNCVKCDWPAITLFVEAATYEAGEAVYAKQGGLCDGCFRDWMREKETVDSQP